MTAAAADVLLCVLLAGTLSNWKVKKSPETERMAGSIGNWVLWQQFKRIENLNRIRDSYEIWHRRQK